MSKKLLKTKNLGVEFALEDHRLLAREAEERSIEPARRAWELIRKGQALENRDRQLLSLFCGPGGLDEGFRRAGFWTRLAFDKDEECVRTFNLNHPESCGFEQDLTELTLARLDDLAKEHLGVEQFRPVGVIGGPPCQSFSYSNVHQSEDDQRHRLPDTYASLLGALNKRSPVSFFLFENVPGLLAPRHRERYSAFKAAFSEAGFDLTEVTDIDAQDFGVPQERKRIFIIGVNRKIHPDAKWAPPVPQTKKITVRNAIGGLPEPELNQTGLDPGLIKPHPNHWCMVPRSDKFKKAGFLKAGIMEGRCFRRLAWDDVSWTVAYGHREVHVHPDGRRRLSIWEAMRLQTFPDTYQFTGNISAQVRLVSEAVPVRLAEVLAQSIRASLGI